MTATRISHSDMSNRRKEVNNLAKYYLLNCFIMNYFTQAISPFSHSSKTKLKHGFKKVSIKICDSVHIVSSTPKLPIPVLEFHVAPSLIYHQTALPFQIPHPISTPVEQINQIQQKTAE